MANEMVERVARAIRSVTMPEAYPAFEDMGPTLRDLYMTKARAAIEAMRDPTDAMYEAGGNEVSHHDGEFGDCNVNFDYGQMDKLWTAMIDAALKEAA